MKSKIKTLSTLLVASTVTMHLMNKAKETKYKDNIIKTEDDLYYETKYGKMRYIKKGTGSPIVLIHSLDIGSSIYEYHKIIDSLSQNNTVYAIDLLGYGLSDKPQLSYTNYLYINILVSFIHDIVGKKTDIITSGDSSTIAIMMNMINNEIINKMTFINPQNIYDMNVIPSKQNKYMNTIYELPIYGTFAYYNVNKEEKMKEKFITDYFYDPAKINKQYIEAYMQSSYIGGSGNKYSFSSVENHYTNINFLKALKSNTKQITLILGSDVNNNETNKENYEHYNSNIRSIAIQNTKKLPHLESPEEVIELLV